MSAMEDAAYYQRHIGELLTGNTVILTPHGWLGPDYVGSYGRTEIAKPVDGRRRAEFDYTCVASAMVYQSACK